MNFFFFPCSGPDLFSRRRIPEMRKERNHQCLPPCFHPPPWISCPQTLKTCCALHSIHPCQYNHGNSTQTTKKAFSSPPGNEGLPLFVSVLQSVIFCGFCGDGFHWILLFLLRITFWKGQFLLLWNALCCEIKAALSSAAHSVNRVGGCPISISDDDASVRHGSSASDSGWRLWSHLSAKLVFDSETKPVSYWEVMNLESTSEISTDL